MHPPRLPKCTVMAATGSLLKRCAVLAPFLSVIATLSLCPMPGVAQQSAIVDAQGNDYFAGSPTDSAAPTTLHGFQPAVEPSIVALTYTLQSGHVPGAITVDVLITETN